MTCMWAPPRRLALPRSRVTQDPHARKGRACNMARGKAGGDGSPYFCGKMLKTKQTAERQAGIDRKTALLLSLPLPLPLPMPLAMPLPLLPPLPSLWSLSRCPRHLLPGPGRWMGHEALTCREVKVGLLAWTRPTADPGNECRGRCLGRGRCRARPGTQGGGVGVRPWDCGLAKLTAQGLELTGLAPARAALDSPFHRQPLHSRSSPRT